MSKTDWEEVKKLAADFQRTQLSSAVQRLSERNCVEIVKKLVELNLIEVIFTCDGKEYLTPDHLVREIDDELAAGGGRVHLTDLVYSLNVDFSHIEAKASKLQAESNGEISLVLGQLVNAEYKDRLADEINEKLLQSGSITVSDLTKFYDLSGDFLQKLIESRLGTQIKGVQDLSDSRTFFTEFYLNQYKSKIRGIFSAITRPTPTSQIVNRYKFPEKIFYSSLDILMKNKELKGSLSGGQTQVYIPDIYARMQLDYTDNFFKQNNYIEYDSMIRIGLSDPKTYLSKRFADVIYLKTCAVSNTLLYQVDSTIEECINTKSFADIQPLLPSVLTIGDIRELFERCVEGNKSLEACWLLSGSVVVSTEFVDHLIVPVEALMSKKAEEDLKNGSLFKIFASQQISRDRELADDMKSSKKDERKKKASSSQKSGGGTQGRETKMKATKKKYNPNKKGGRDMSDDEDTREDSNELVFLSTSELADKFAEGNKLFEDAPGDLADSIAERVYSRLNNKYCDVAKQVFVTNTSSSKDTKKTHSDLQASMNNMYSSIYLYNQGLTALANNETLQTQLLKWLQKSLCTDALNSLITFVSSEQSPNLTNNDSRTKVINKLDSGQKDALTKLNLSVNTTIEEYLENLLEASSKCDVFIKPVDKKREKLLYSENRQNLIHQLNEATDSALILHLAVMLIFQTITKLCIHASGKFVPQLISHLKPHLDRDTIALLIESEHLVIKQLKLDKDTSDDERLELETRLGEIGNRLKEVAINMKNNE